MSPLIIAALIEQLGVPELLRWLNSLHASGQVITEQAALDKLNLDVDAGNAAGAAFIARTNP